MTKIRTAVLGLAIVAYGLPQGAFAACEQNGPLICGKGMPRIASADGLQVSRGGDFAPLAPQSGLRGGDRILVGSADATLSLGPSCSTVVGAGSMVSISPNGNEICASVTDAATGVSPTALGIGAAAAATAIGVGIALSGKGGGGQNTPLLPISSK